MIFDKGANSALNTQIIRADNLQYITGKKLNKSDDKIIAEVETNNPHIIDEESGIRGIKSRIRTVQDISSSQKTAERAAGSQSQQNRPGYKKQRSFRRVLTRIRLFQKDSG